jgi:hypothetical protein
MHDGEGPLAQQAQQERQDGAAAADNPLPSERRGLVTTCRLGLNVKILQRLGRLNGSI